MNKVVFPGSFDPITLGHLDIISRLCKKYDEVHVVIAVNSSKKGFLTVDERIELIKGATAGFDNLNITSTDGLIVEFCKSVKSKTIIRGVRSIYDFTSEQNLAYNNYYLDSEIETVLFLTRPEHMHISSSGVRELNAYHNDIRHLVPENVASFLEKK